MNKTIRRLFWWILTVAWSGCIVYLSLQDASQSASLSTGLTKRILEWFPSYLALPETEQLAVLSHVQGLVRELAHVAEHAVLGLLTALLVHSYRPRRFVAVAFGATAVFAVADECVQEFLSVGRAFQVVDLLKDWLGLLLGIGCIWLVCFVAKRTSYKRK